MPAYNLGGPCVRAVKGTKVPGGKSKPPTPDRLVNACAKQLESLNEVALKQIQGGSPNGLAVEYRQLPEVIFVHFFFLSYDSGLCDGGVFLLCRAVLLLGCAMEVVRCRGACEANAV